MDTKNVLETNISSLLDIGIEKHNSGKFDEAEIIYKQIIDSQPVDSLGNIYPIAMINLGSVLQEQGKYTQAIQVYNQVLKHYPKFAEAYNNLGNIYLEQEKLVAAIQCYESALEIKPDLPNTYNNLGNALKNHDLNKAIECYHKALKLNPDLVDAHYNLATALGDQGKLEEALFEYEKTLKLKPDFALAQFGFCMNQLPIIYSSVGEIQTKRNRYQQELEKLAHQFQLASLQSRIQAAVGVGGLQPFYLTYQGLNDRPLQKNYGEMICQLMASCYPQLSQPIQIPNLAPQDKIRVGIVSGFFREHSNWKIPIRGWLENLNRSEFELFGYHTNPKRDEETVRAAKLFDKFIQGPLRLEHWCELIRQDNLHILIFPEFGMDPMTVKLGCLRFAPIQMTSWGHPETSGLPTIDYYLSSDLMEADNAQEHYTENLVRLPNLSIYYAPLSIQPQAVNKEEIGIANHDIMFWCCQSLFKYLPQHDDVFPRIALELSNSKFVFINHHNSDQVTEIFRQRLSRAFTEFGMNFQDYCIFLPYMESSKFAGTAAIADIFLDSIGWSGCNSTLEAIAHNTPVVTLPGELMRGRHSMAILKMMGTEETIAANKDEYVQIAVRLGQDAQYRQHISQQVAENKHKLYGDLEPVRALENLFLQLLNKSRRFTAPELADTLQLATQHLRSGRFVDAEQLYHQVLLQQPEHPEALYGLGILAMQMGQLETAERWLNTAAQFQADVKIWFILGNVRHTLGDLEGAELAYRAAIELRPDGASIYNNLGYCLQQQGKWSDAILSYRKALEVQPNCAEADVNLGNALHAQGELPVDKQEYYALLNLSLGVARKQVGDIKTAIAYYERAIAIQPNFVDARYELGLALEEQGNWSAAIACYQKILELNPQHEEAKNSLDKIPQHQEA